MTGSVAQQITELIQTWNQREAQLRNWLGGSANGGPNNDGRYPLVDALGRETLVPSPAHFADMVEGPAAAAVTAMANAGVYAEAADLSAQTATAKAALAAAHEAASLSARNLAEQHRSFAGNHEANARYWAELAEGMGANTTADRIVVEQLREETVEAASEATGAASNAAVSAAAAATFDPAIYTRKTDTIHADRMIGVLAPDRIPVLPSQLQFASSGDLSDLTQQQQDEIGQGSIVTTTDGFRRVYKGGTGDKTDPASYTVLADLTPEWTSITGKPPSFPASAHTHDYLPLAGGTLNGSLAVTSWLTTSNGAFSVSSSGAVSATSLSVSGAGNFGTGLVTGNLRHSAGYFEIFPYSSTYDDGSYVRAYWDGNNQRLRVNSTKSGANPELWLGPNRVWDASNLDPTKLLAATGTVSAPTLSFASDPNTGFYSGGNGIIGVTVNGVERMSFYGNDFQMKTGSIDFGSRTGQHIQLYSTSYGAGIQNSTLYLRTGNRFAIHRGGSHSDETLDPGSGGSVMMSLDNAGMQVNGNPVWHSGSLQTFNLSTWQSWQQDSRGNNRFYLHDDGHVYFRAANSTTGNFYFQTGAGAAVAYFYGNRRVYFYNTVQMPDFSITSDERLKTDILPLTDHARFIDGTNVYSYLKNGRKEWGPIAQEMQKGVAPFAVIEADEENENGFKELAVNDRVTLYALLAEVKDLRVRLAEAGL